MVDVGGETSGRIERNVLKWLDHTERMNEKRKTKIELGRGRTRLRKFEKVNM